MAIFTASQIATINNLYQSHSDGSNYSNIYQYIASVLPENSPERLWFEGAAQANAGQGIYSALIRTYSKVQMDLRGIPYSESLMQ